MKKLLLVMLAIVSTQVLAKDGSSGCGPGWYVAKKNSLLSSSLRGTTNGFLAPTVTFGMTFGTSNCAKHSIVKMEKETLKFITDNYYEVAFESSKGEGDFISSYQELLGCQSSQTYFKTQIKNNFGKIYNGGENTPEQVLKETYNVILKDARLANNCFKA